MSELNLDVRTVIVLNAIGAFLMGAGLLGGVARSYQGRIPGVSRWGLATLLQATVWMLHGLRDVRSDFSSAVLGPSMLMWSLAMYFHALVAFTGRPVSTRWAYALAAATSAAITWFLLVVPNATARIVIASICGAIYLFAAAFLLLTDRKPGRPASHWMMALVCGSGGAVLALRAVYRLWITAAEQPALAPNTAQNLAYLSFYMATVVLTFAFVLMCNDRYNAEIRRLAIVAENTGAGVLIGNAAQRIEWVNPAFTAMTGFTLADAVGRRPAELLQGPDTDLSIVAQMRSAVAQNQGYDVELQHYRKDRTAFWVRNKVDLVRDSAGRMVQFVGVHTDISAHKQAEAEIVRLNAELEQRVHDRTAQLENANKELEAFSYAVAHDLRTPLSSIDGFSHLLETMVADERGKHYLQRIRVGVKHMDELTQALLSLSRITRSALRWERVDLTAVAARALTGCLEQDPERVVKVDLKEGMLAIGDPHLLQQVMENLIGNAWKFSSHRPQAEISVGCEDGPDQEAVFHVRDNGAGFDMAYANKLFGAFERLHTPGDYAGTGIGLATVHRIIGRHAGRVWAESTPGHGATFYFTLGTTPR